ncbi:bacillithiol biosynthesis deacetylase BshB1 [Anaerobranca californiensis DSM 14826]|uniref:Bacillithiol biosynthesis deacetylase BshB1 n=1 Tax=Anaerobranca californiensis DSM 14826 TaxID=1120989 RepID=A0A1M6RRY2_9FIRM|nr:bacillithiol biosynthesis deacetylase BshB1 [Anaerobranca californiensis]SHK35144.1 bacillithiol biosynthesis deacetylase BshB1 [Anaerobranca californiensis DSM 14826]
MIDIMAIGAHPDDVEIGVGGILGKYKGSDIKRMIVDLTMGEMGTNGTPEIRKKEGKKAAEILGCQRVVMDLPDGKIRVNEENLIKVIELIRRYRPKIILTHYPDRDQHPDHYNSALLVTQAAHLAGLAKYPAKGERFRPQKIYHFFLPKYIKPSLIVDVTSSFSIKMEALKAHESQFFSRDKGLPTNVNREDVFDRIETSAKYHGQTIGVKYGEPLYYSGVLGIENIMDIGRL